MYSKNYLQPKEMPAKAAQESHPFPRIAIANVEWTARPVRHRQQQLRQLHATLLKYKDECVQAIEEDFRYTPTEALFAYSLTLKETRIHYDSVSLPDENGKARKVEQEQENSARSVPVGIVYIIPTAGLHCVISPVAAALAAGNCIVVELARTTGHTNSLLQKMLLEALSNDTFTISTTRPDPAFLANCQIVSQTDLVPGMSTLKTVFSPPAARCFAFVDREANVELAARNIVHARCGFGARSSYAPEIVFIHEAVLRLFKYYLEQVWAARRPQKQADARKLPTKSEISSRSLRKGLNTLLSGPECEVIEVQDRNDKMLFSYLDNPTLALCSIDSTDDGIDLATDICGTEGIAAAFFFASPSAANYLSTSLNAHLSFINHIPTELLVGSRIPTVSDGSLVPRYPRALFEEIRPQICKPSEITTALGTQIEESGNLEAWARSMEKPLLSDELSGKRIDFFEQALIAAASVSVLSLVTVGVLGSILVRRLR